MNLPQLIRVHCKKHRIRWTHEGEDAYEFIAPKGKVFANESKYRILEIDYMTARECVDVLSLCDKTWEGRR